MSLRWSQAPSCYLRSELEDRVSALLLSTGFGLSVAGTIALAMRGCHDPISQWTSVAYFSIVTLTLAISIVYYAGWGTWIRRRIRDTLRIMVMICCGMVWIPLLLVHNAHPTAGVVIVLINMGNISWVVKKKLPHVDHALTLWSVWVSFLALTISLCAAIIYSDISDQALAVPLSLFTLGGTALILPYRPWLHTVWHVLALASCAAYYIVTWHYLP